MEETLNTLQIAAPFRRDLPRVRMVYKAAFSELMFPSERLQQAFELIDNYFNPA